MSLGSAADGWFQSLSNFLATICFEVSSKNERMKIGHCVHCVFTLKYPMTIKYLSTVEAAPYI